MNNISTSMLPSSEIRIIEQGGKIRFLKKVFNGWSDIEANLDLSGAVRYDTALLLTNDEKLRARRNIGVPVFGKGFVYNRINGYDIALHNNDTKLDVSEDAYSGLTFEQSGPTDPFYLNIKLGINSGLDINPTGLAVNTAIIATRNFVNSSIATNTATFHGTLDVVTDLGLDINATHAQVSSALKNHEFEENPDNNDYVFVSFSASESIAGRFDRYKYNGTSWEYEYTLNNSSFTQDLWEAISSGITSGLVAKLTALPTAESLAQTLLKKYEKPTNGIPKTDLENTVQTSLNLADAALQSSDIIDNLASEAPDKPISARAVSVDMVNYVDACDTLLDDRITVVESIWQKGTGNNSVVQKNSGSVATGELSVAQGSSTTASGKYSHTEGRNTVASGQCSHAEGDTTQASGLVSHAEGDNTQASGGESHAEGYHTIAQNLTEHAEGQYNSSHKNSTIYGDSLNTQHSVGIGKYGTRKNAFEIMQNGDMYMLGVGGYDGTNPADSTTVQHSFTGIDSYRSAFENLAQSLGASLNKTITIAWTGDLEDIPTFTITDN